MSMPTFTAPFQILQRSPKPRQLSLLQSPSAYSADPVQDSMCSSGRTVTFQFVPGGFCQVACFFSRPVVGGVPGDSVHCHRRFPVIPCLTEQDPGQQAC